MAPTKTFARSGHGWSELLLLEGKGGRSTVLPFADRLGHSGEHVHTPGGRSRGGSGRGGLLGILIPIEIIDESIQAWAR